MSGRKTKGKKFKKEGGEESQIDVQEKPRLQRDEYARALVEDGIILVNVHGVGHRFRNVVCGPLG